MLPQAVFWQKASSVRNECVAPQMLRIAPHPLEGALVPLSRSRSLGPSVSLNRGEGIRHGNIPKVSQMPEALLPRCHEELPEMPKLSPSQRRVVHFSSVK